MLARRGQRWGSEVVKKRKGMERRGRKEGEVELDTF